MIINIKILTTYYALLNSVIFSRVVVEQVKISSGIRKDKVKSGGQQRRLPSILEHESSAASFDFRVRENENEKQKKTTSISQPGQQQARWRRGQPRRTACRGVSGAATMHAGGENLTAPTSHSHGDYFEATHPCRLQLQIRLQAISPSDLRSRVQQIPHLSISHWNSNQDHPAHQRRQTTPGRADRGRTTWSWLRISGHQIKLHAQR